MFSIYNTGKTTLYNVQVKFVADSVADAEKQLAPTGLSMLEKDIYASHIYQSVVHSKFPAENALSEINEYRNPIIKL